MSRRDRRRYKPRDPSSAHRMLELLRRVEDTGRPGVIHGLTDACRDCGATGEIHLLPGRRAVGHVFHDPGCPAANGVTRWQPDPIT